MSAELIYDKCSKTRFPLPTKDDIAKLEQKLAIKLTEPYANFLLQFNGCSFRNAVVSFGAGQSDFLTYLHGIGATFDSAELGEDLDLFEGTTALPIGGTGFGSLILLDLDRGDVYLKQPNDENAELIAGSIHEFFAQLSLDFS